MFSLTSYAAIAATLAASVTALPAQPVLTKSHPLGKLPEAEFKALSLSTVVPQMNPISLDDLVKNSTEVHPFIPSELQKRINGNDDRYQFTDQNNQPFSNIGKFVRSDNIICSASLIGPQHVILAHHCINGEGSDPPVTMSFYPGYDNGPGPIGGAQVTQAFWVDAPSTDNGCDTKYDFAILLIDQRFGDQLGYFGQVLPDSSRFDQAIFTNLGYPGNRDNTERPYREDNISLPSNTYFTQLVCDGSTGPIYSNGYVTPGDSGSPLWADNQYIWGITSIEISVNGGEVGGGYASGDAMQNLINQLRSQYP